VQSLTHILQSLNKVTDSASPHVGMVITPEGLELKASTDGITAFARLRADCFSSFHVSSKAHDKIAMELHPRVLLEALRSADKAVQTELALTMKQGIKCITVTTESPNSIVVIQDAPIPKLLREEEMDALREPAIQAPRVQLVLPDARKLKSVLERIKAHDKFVKVRGSDQGTLILKVNNEMLQTRTCFEAAVLGTPSGREVTASASVRDLLVVTASLAVKSHRALLGMTDGFSIVVNVQLDDEDLLSLVYLLPTTEVPDDEF